MMLVKLMLSLVMLHLDFCNGISLGLPQKTLSSFQRIQRLCAKAILRRGRYDSVTEALKQLNWLPIKACVEYKIILIVFKTLNGLAPQYLVNLSAKLPEPTRTLRFHSAYSNKPRVKNMTFAARSFSARGPELWNQLPRNITSCQNIEAFRSLLRLFL